MLPFPLRILSPLALVLVAAQASGESITGVCPDGSIYVVQRVQAIPCRNSKTIADPSDVPPIKPEYLPKPYGWERFHRRNDPNNPYNLVESPSIAEGSEPAPTPSSPVRPELAAVTPPPVSAPPPRSAQPELGLADSELRDLTTIVGLAQQRAPATLRGGADHEAVVQLARSAAFETRLRDALAREGREDTGSVVLFSAAGPPTDTFHAQLTFVQGHVAFHPDRADPFQLGMLRGRLGTLSPDEPVLGYVVLPAHVDPAKPMDIYWHDRQITTTLRP